MNTYSDRIPALTTLINVWDSPGRAPPAVPLQRCRWSHRESDTVGTQCAPQSTGGCPHPVTNNDVHEVQPNPPFQHQELPKSFGTPFGIHEWDTRTHGKHGYTGNTDTREKQTHRTHTQATRSGWCAAGGATSPTEGIWSTHGTTVQKYAPYHGTNQRYSPKSPTFRIIRSRGRTYSRLPAPPLPSAPFPQSPAGPAPASAPAAGKAGQWTGGRG
jgi:hypothetical protein